MKTIQEAANICGMQMCDKYEMTIDMSITCEDSFEAGVEFAEEWIQIERYYYNSEVTKECMDEISNHIPYLAQTKNGDYVVCNSCLDVKSTPHFIKWRPITRK